MNKDNKMTDDEKHKALLRHLKDNEINDVHDENELRRNIELELIKILEAFSLSEVVNIVSSVIIQISTDNDELFELGHKLGVV